MRALLHTLLISLAFLAPSTALARGPQQDAIPYVAAAELPREAQETLASIRRGGPFAFPKDHSVFHNRERLLPSQPRGYYREYTVVTPGVRHRGARRIVAGKGAGGDVRTSGEYYYTDDHYRSFRRILP